MPIGFVLTAAGEWEDAAKSLSVRVNANRTGVRLGNKNIRRNEDTGPGGLSGMGEHSYEFLEFNRLETSD